MEKKLTTVAGLTETLSEISQDLAKYTNFRNGEGQEYSQAVNEAKDVLARLPEGLEFRVEFIESSLKLYVLVGILKIEVFSVYLDTFSRGGCLGYAQGQISYPAEDFVSKVKRVE